MGVNLFDNALCKALEERRKSYLYISQSKTEFVTNDKLNHVHNGISFDIPDDIRQKMVFDDDDYNLLSKVYKYDKYLKYIREYNYGVLSKDKKIMNFDKLLQDIYAIFYKDKYNFIYKDNNRYVPNLKYDNKSYKIPMDHEYIDNYINTIIKFKYKGKEYRFTFNDKSIPNLYDWITRYDWSDYQYNRSVPVSDFIKKLNFYYNKLLEKTIIADPMSLYDWIMKCEAGDNNGIY